MSIIKEMSKKGSDMITIQQHQVFVDEWKKVSTVVESEARRQLQTIGHLDYSILNDILRDERSLWFKKNSIRRQWLEGLADGGGIDKKKLVMKIRQVYLQDKYRLGDKSVSMIGLKIMYLMISLFVGFLVWVAIDLCFSPTMQELHASPLKWAAFPLLVTILVFTFCRPYIIRRKKKRTEEIIFALKKELDKNGQEILHGIVKKQ